MFMVCKMKRQSDPVLNDTDIPGNDPQTMLPVLPLKPSPAPEEVTS